MLPLVAVNGEAGDESFSGPMLPTPELARCRYLQQVLASFGVTVGRTRLMRLSGGAEVKLHVDQGYYWTERVRIHVPVVTQPTVSFECGGSVINMAAGECWIFDTWRLHRVLNADDRSRIHLVCDTTGGEPFWNMVDAGKAIGNGAELPAWQPKRIDFDDAAEPSIRFESYNVPSVMSPWELKHHLDFLLAEMVPSPSVEPLRRHAGDFYRAWRGLWAGHGDSEEAGPEYRKLLAAFLAKAKPYAANAKLRNDSFMLPALTLMVARTALMDTQAPGRSEPPLRTAATSRGNPR
ncbi:MAG: aspartyl/asparaginyl beta-hydroxylase domain-containing protein [Pseudoxanthomonas sp.]